MHSVRRVLLVDGANVVGSVPDGWWRDRPGAAARLHAELVAACSDAGSAKVRVHDEDGQHDETPDHETPRCDGAVGGDETPGYDESVGCGETVLVLEGQARAGVPAGQDRGVRTVHARGSGDDEIVRQCQLLVADGAEVAVATADRGLIARLPGAGVAIVGPRSIRPAAGPPARQPSTGRLNPGPGQPTLHGEASPQARPAGSATLHGEA